MRTSVPENPAIRIVISSRQAVCRLARRRIAKLLVFLLRKSMCSREARGETVFTLVVTDNRRMPEFKHRCFGIREVTDVIAAAYKPLPGESTEEAELVVNAERALDVVTGRFRPGRLAHLSRSGAPGWDLSSEFALYLAHGVDHLSGADDATPQDRRRMRQRELRWLREAGVKGLVNSLLRPSA